MDAAVNEIIYPQIQMDRESFGITSGWQISTLNQATNTITDISASVAEAIRTITSPRSATLTSTAVAGNITISTNPGTITLQQGDVFSDGAGNIYYIDTVSSGIITLREKLKANIVSGATIQQVGNTAIYSVPVSFSGIGKYSVIIRNSTISLSYSIPVTVSNTSNSDIYTQIVLINAKLAQISAILAQLKFGSYV